MEEIDVFKSLRESVDGELAPIVDEREAARLKLIADHKAWIKKIKKEHPSPYQFFKVGVYIRYFNQTKYENYLDNHKMQFIDLIQGCPNWTLVDFYVDQGQNAPKMENAPEWCRLLDDCFNNKVDLIITHKVSNVSRDADELTFCARLLSARKHPVGMYFIGEDIFTLASYYQRDLRDRHLLIRAVVESYGLQIGKTRAPGTITCVSTLERIFDKYGYEILERTLRLVIGSWEGDLASFGANILSAVATVAYVDGEKINDEIFVEKVGACSVKSITRTARERRPGLPGFWEAILLAYNFKKKSQSDEAETEQK